MKKIISIILIITSIVYADSKTQNLSFDEMLKVLQAKEALQNDNKQLKIRIQTLEDANTANDKKYQALLDQFNSIKKNKDNSKIEMNQLLEKEKQNRLPIPYLIINNKYAKVLKLHWYYTRIKDKNAFNGYYSEDEIKPNEIILDYKVKNITSNGITYCSINKSSFCVTKNILPLKIKNKLKDLVIVDGISNQMLNENSELTPLITKLLKSSNPITKNSKNDTNTTKNKVEDIMVEPINTSGQRIPRNNIPDLSNINQEHNAIPPLPSHNIPRKKGK